MILHADARHIPLADESVHCVVTSPPYWGLRDYGIGDNSLGLEPTPELYVEHMVEVFREVKRVLRKDGTCWVNLGDSYAGGGGFCPTAPSTSESKSGKYGITGALIKGQNKALNGLKPKDLCGIPWRVAFALQADGWWLRSDIIWSKPNPMPESVTDRPTKSHEYIFLLTKSSTYYFDQDAVREPNLFPDRSGTNPRLAISTQPGNTYQIRDGERTGIDSNPAGRNIRTVWTMPTEPFPDAHFATFPSELAMRCVLAGSPLDVCRTCGAPWERVTDTPQWYKDLDGHKMPSGNLTQGVNAGFGAKSDAVSKPSITLGFSPTCSHDHETRSRGIVLDPFAGSGTTIAAAQDCGRIGIGLDLKPDYLKMAVRRTAQLGLGL